MGRRCRAAAAASLVAIASLAAITAIAAITGLAEGCAGHAPSLAARRPAPRPPAASA